MTVVSEADLHVPQVANRHIRASAKYCGFRGSVTAARVDYVAGVSESVLTDGLLSPRGGICMTTQDPGLAEIAKG